MIGWLQGTWHDGVVRTGAGVGYSVTSSGIHTDGEAVEFFVHTIVREDSITLWGLQSHQEVAVFCALLKVQGVGPAVAMNVVRDVGMQKLAAAVAAQDPAMVRAKGVGSKTAARIVAEIVMPEGIEAEERSPAHELADVLVKLGFAELQALEAAKDAIEADPQADEAGQLATALVLVRQGGPR
jgi:Holliday junction DNA helicase RuvA